MSKKAKIKHMYAITESVRMPSSRHILRTEIVRINTNAGFITEMQSTDLNLGKEVCHV